MMSIYMDRTVDERYTHPDRYSPLDGFDKLSMTDEQIIEERQIFIENYKRDFSVKSEYIDKAVNMENYEDLCDLSIELKKLKVDKSILNEINKMIELRWYEWYSSFWYKNNFKFNKEVYTNEN